MAAGCEDEGHRVTQESLIQPAGWRREGGRGQRMDERRGGIEHLSGLGHIWLKYMSPVWGVIFIRQPDKPELHRQRFFVIQQDSITAACPPLPSQSRLINTERMLFSNFSFHTLPPSPLVSLLQSPSCLSSSHRAWSASEGDISDKSFPQTGNNSLKLICLLTVAIFFSPFSNLYPWFTQLSLTQIHNLYPTFKFTGKFLNSDSC